MCVIVKLFINKNNDSNLFLFYVLFYIIYKKIIGL